MQDNFAIDSLMPIDSRREEGENAAAPMRGDFNLPGLMPLEKPRADTNVGETDPVLFKLSVDGAVLTFGGLPMTFDVV